MKNIKNEPGSFYTTLVGGLGNQLFMIFNIISLATKYGKKFYINFDKNYKRDYKIKRVLSGKIVLNINYLKIFIFKKKIKIKII